MIYVYYNITFHSKYMKRYDFRELQQFQNYEAITSAELYKWIRLVRDPEHPSMTLEDLKVLNINSIQVSDEHNTISVEFVPTTPNCSMGAVIGLAIKVLLMRIVPLRFHIEVKCKENTHDTWKNLNKQINDKERVLAALSNPNVMKVIEQSLTIEL